MLFPHCTVAFGRWVLDDPFPRFRSHGRINVTGSGNLGLDGHALVPLCVEIEIAVRSMQFVGEEERLGTGKRMLSLRCAEKHRAGAQLVSCS